MYKSVSLKIITSHRSHLALWMLIGALVLTGHAAPDVLAVSSEDEVAFGLQESRPNWRLEMADGFTLVLERLEPDMARTFYLARGFKLEAANRYAGTCVYKTVLKNSAKQGEMEVNLRDWQVFINGTPKPFKIEPDWQKHWEKLSVSPSARIAFRWSQFRPEQIHGPGDWLQGMSNPDLEPDSTFDLKVVWRKDNKTNQAILKNIKCGPPEKK